MTNGLKIEPDGTIIVPLHGAYPLHNFETMICKQTPTTGGGEEREWWPEQWRYTTRKETAKGHDYVCDYLQRKVRRLKVEDAPVSVIDAFIRILSDA